jgi:hypothetical protein
LNLLIRLFVARSGVRALNRNWIWGVGGRVLLRAATMAVVGYGTRGGCVGRRLAGVLLCRDRRLRLARDSAMPRSCGGDERGRPEP